MTVWAIGDLHLSFGTPGKEMDVFGDHWINHPKKIELNWKQLITDKDLVLIPGDISWAKDLASAMPDLEWIDSLPGTKVMIKGNHDYWWQAISKIRKTMPPSIHVIQHDTFEWEEYIIGGTRLWDNIEFNFNAYIPNIENPASDPDKTEVQDTNEAERILLRELARLKMSLEGMGNSKKERIVMTHYPPVSANTDPSRTSALLKKYNVHTCVFGHLHNVQTSLPMFGEKEGIRYILASADYIDFVPIKIFN